MRRFAVAAAVGAVASFVVIARAVVGHAGRDVERQCPSLEWDSVAESAVLPEVPTLLRASPMQEWWERQGREAWSVATITDIAATTAAGEYNVTLQSQPGSPCFVPHKGLSGNGITAPVFELETLPLRAALEQLWPPASASNEAIPKAAVPTHRYLSASIEDLPPAIAEAVLEYPCWSPNLRLRDTPRFFGS